MPLVNVDVIRGRTTEELRTLLNTIHEVMVNALEVPDTDRYQILTQHDPEGVVALDTSLGMTRSTDLVIIRFTSRERPERAKVALYAQLSEQLSRTCGVRPDDLIVTIVENNAADWSFGGGEAQFITGAL